MAILPKRKFDKAVLIDANGSVVQVIKWEKGTTKVAGFTRQDMRRNGWNIVKGKNADALKNVRQRWDGKTWNDPDTTLVAYDSRTGVVISKLKMWKDEPLPEVPDHVGFTDQIPPSRQSIYDEELQKWGEARKCVKINVSTKTVENFETVGPKTPIPSGYVYEDIPEGADVEIGWTVSGRKGNRQFSPSSPEGE